MKQADISDFTARLIARMIIADVKKQKALPKPKPIPTRTATGG